MLVRDTNTKNLGHPEQSKDPFITQHQLAHKGIPITIASATPSRSPDSSTPPPAPSQFSSDAPPPASSLPMSDRTHQSPSDPPYRSMRFQCCIAVAKGTN